MFGRRRPKTPQGAGSPSVVGASAPEATDVEVATGVGAPVAPRPAVDRRANLARIAAGTLMRTDFGREIWVDEHVGVLVALQQWHTAHRSVITVVNDEGVDTFEVSAFDTVIYETQGATK